MVVFFLNHKKSYARLTHTCRWPRQFLCWKQWRVYFTSTCKARIIVIHTLQLRAFFLCSLLLWSPNREHPTVAISLQLWFLEQTDYNQHYYLSHVTFQIMNYWDQRMSYFCLLNGYQQLITFYQLIMRFPYRIRAKWLKNITFRKRHINKYILSLNNLELLWASINILIKDMWYFIVRAI